jgi:hypothetical protein
MPQNMKRFLPFSLALLCLITILGATQTPPATRVSFNIPEASSPQLITLRLDNLRLLPNGLDGNVTVQLRREGDTLSAVRASADYNQVSTNEVQLLESKLEANTLTAKLLVTINPDTPRPRTIGYPNPADVIRIDLRAQITTDQAPFTFDPQAFLPPWRRDNIALGGRLVTGTYTASYEGTVTGSIQPTQTAGNVLIENKGDATLFSVRLAPRRVAGPNGAFVLSPFASPQDWSGFDTLRLTVDAPKRRDDVAVAVRLDTSSGTRYLASAALLRDKPTTFDVDLDRLASNRSAVTQIGIGAENPHGVGDVQFTLHAIELLKLRTDPAPPSPVVITVDACSTVTFDGVSSIHKGLFGFHDVGESSPREANAGEPEALAYVAQLNPGLLRPLTHTGFVAPWTTAEEARARASTRPAAVIPPIDPTTRPTFAQRARAASALDNVVWTYTQDLWNRPSWMDDMPAKENETDNVLRKIEVWNEPFMWARHTNMGHNTPARPRPNPGNLNPVAPRPWTDHTQFGYLPGKLGAEAYVLLFDAAHKGAKSVNPSLQLGGPSAPEFLGDDYATLENYVARILQQIGPRLDFITEHHYGGDPRTFAASYDVLTAWNDVNLNRRIPIINTEANNLGASSAGKAAYNIEDILTCIKYTPAHVQGRAMHAMWNGYLNDAGERDAYTLLSTLRGRLRIASSSSDDVVVVASKNGRDLVVVAFNRSSSARAIDFKLPDRHEVSETLLLLADAPANELQVKDTEGQLVEKPAAGATKLVKVAGNLPEIPARSAVRWTLRESEPIANAWRAFQIRQFFSTAVLQRLKPSDSFTADVRVPKDFEGPASAARLRVVTRDVHDGEAVAVIGGSTYTLPYSSCNDASAIIQEIDIDPALVKPGMTIQFKSADPARSNGFTVYSASIIATR